MYNRVDNGKDYDDDENEEALVGYNLEQYPVNLSSGDGSQNSGDNGNDDDEDEIEVALVRDNNMEQFRVNLSSRDGSQNDKNGDDDDDREVELGSHSWVDCLVAELYIFSRDDNQTNENYSDDNNSCSTH